VRQHDREKAKLEQRALRNTEKRDKAVRKAHAAGMTMRDIAKVAGISHQRVAQIVKGD
jgi:DNA-directed RNA polymerase specialized sigma subunit